MAALTSLISGCGTFWKQARTSAKRHEHSIEWTCAHTSVQHLLKTSQNIGQAPWAFARMDMCAYKCSINQSISQTRQTATKANPFGLTSITNRTNASLGTRLNDQQILIISHGETNSRTCWAPFLVKARIEPQYLSACESNALLAYLSWPPMYVSLPPMVEKVLEDVS
jgi:hypothetical protein